MAVELAKPAFLKPFGKKAHRFAFRKPAEDKRFTVLTGSVRSSKTFSMLPKLLQLCKYEVGGARMIVAASKEAAKANVLNDLFELIGPKNYRYNSQSGELWLFGKRWRVVGASNEGSERVIRGSTIGILYIDEGVLIPSSFMRMVLSRLSPPGARCYITTNPDSPYHFLKKEIIDNKELNAAGRIETISFYLYDNPNLDDDYRAMVKNLYHGLFYKRFILGEWIMAEGAIYATCFTDDLQYKPSEEPIGLRQPGGHVQRIIAIDYGTTNPFVALDIYDDGKIWWFVNEYRWDSKEKYQQKSDAEYGADMARFIGNNQSPIVIVDPSAASFKVELASRGIFALDAKNDVLDGIRIFSTMQARKLIRVNSVACEAFIKEMQTYAWNERSALIGKEEPIKMHDHGPDAGRYAGATLLDDYRLAA